MNKVHSDLAPAAIGPYSQGIFHNGLLFVSGQIAADVAHSGTIKQECEQVLKNIGNILASVGFDYTNVAKCSIFLTDMANFTEINEVYGSFFQEPFPARETVEVSALPKGVRVEISCIAVAK
jgi:2-iminobutanoate/2-iminopropanoate deaminase